MILFHINKSDLNYQINEFFHITKTSYQKIESEISLFDQKSSIKFSFFRSNSNHLFFSRIFQNFIFFINNSIVFFYLFDNFNIQSKSFEIDSDIKLRNSYVSIQHINIETIFFVWKLIRKHIHRFIKFVFFFHSFDEFDISSKNRYHFEFKNSQYSRCFNIEIIYFFREHFQNIFVFLSIDYIFWFQR